MKWIATQELSDTEILNEIRDGIDEINSGEFVRFNDVRRNVWYHSIEQSK